MGYSICMVRGVILKEVRSNLDTKTLDWDIYILVLETFHRSWYCGFSTNMCTWSIHTSASLFLFVFSWKPLIFRQFPALVSSKDFPQIFWCKHYWVCNSNSYEINYWRRLFCLTSLCFLCSWQTALSLYCKGRSSFEPNVYRVLIYNKNEVA